MTREKDFLSSEDVVSIDNTSISDSSSLLKVSDLVDYVVKSANIDLDHKDRPVHRSRHRRFDRQDRDSKSNLSNQINPLAQWIEKEMKCETLRLGEKQWKKGYIKVRIVVEFLPEQESEALSDLDEFRNNQ